MKLKLEPLTDQEIIAIWEATLDETLDENPYCRSRLWEKNIGIVRASVSALLSGNGVCTPNNRNASSARLFCYADLGFYSYQKDYSFHRQYQNDGAGVRRVSKGSRKGQT